MGMVGFNGLSGSKVICGMIDEVHLVLVNGVA